MKAPTKPPTTPAAFAVVACGVGSCMTQWLQWWLHSAARVDIKKRKLDNAAKYAEKYTPERALLQMHHGRVPEAERPSIDQLKEKRRPDVRPSRYSTDTVGMLRQFVASPPAGVTILHEQVVITAEKVRIPFRADKAWELAGTCELTSFLMDFTFNTNKQGLLLGSAGPVGIRTSANGMPSMRYLPALFMVCDAEDTEAHRLCARILLDSREYTDAFLDYACLQGAAHECGDCILFHLCV